MNRQSTSQTSGDAYLSIARPTAEEAGHGSGFPWESPGWAENAEQRTPSGFSVASGREPLVDHCEFSAKWDWTQHHNDELQSFVESISKQTPSRPNIITGQHDGGLLYRPTADHEIRVFVLDAGHGSDPICGKLEYVNIEFGDVPYSVSYGVNFTVATDFAISLHSKSRIPYTAISYCWGQSGRDHSAGISGQAVGITATVDAVLRNLRQTDKSVNLWIDQLCINQTDRVDKASQVKLMGKIYTRARNTLIWLGEEAENGAFRVMQGLHEAMIGRDDDLLEDELEYLRKPLHEAPIAFQTLERLFQRPWFQRTWVVQEAVLSRDPYFIAGSDTIAWEAFAGNCVSIRGLDLFRQTTAPGYRNLVDMYLARSYYRSFSSSQGLLTWLVDTRYAAVTLKVDKVFGILGLCQSSILPDYSRSSENVFHEVTIAAVEQILAEKGAEEIEKPNVRGALLDRRWYMILTCIDHEVTMSPSWVPDWSQPRTTTVLSFDTTSLGIYRAGGLEYGQILALQQDRPTFTLSRNQQDLTARSVFVSKIMRLSEAFIEAELTATNPSTLSTSLRSVVEFVEACRATFSQSIDFSTVCSTLVAGKDGTGRERYPLDYVEIISQLMDETTGRHPSISGQTYTQRQRKGFFKLEHLSRRKPGRTFGTLKKAYRNAMLNRRLCWTSVGLALVPRFAKQDDDVVIFPWQPVPFVIRKQELGGYIVIGECYVHDLMDGEWTENATQSACLINIV